MFLLLLHTSLIIPHSTKSDKGNFINPVVAFGSRNLYNKGKGADIMDYRKHLTEDILPFWLDNAIDEELGGIFTRLDEKGNLYGTEKSPVHFLPCSQLRREGPPPAPRR